MKEKVFEILGEIKAAILTYDGENMLEDEIIESAEIMDIIMALEDNFGFEVPPQLILPEYFATKESILALAEEAAKEA